MYRNKELIIKCKLCGKEKRVASKRELHPNGNFCSQACFIAWAKINLSIPEEEKRRRWNKYQNEYKRKQRQESEPYVVRKIRRDARKLSKRNREQVRIKNRGIRKEKELWTKWRKGFWRKHHSEMKKEQRRRYRIKHPEKRRNGNGGITKEAFEKIKAEHGYRCAICGRKEPFLDQYWHWLVQDHIIPRSKGGKKRSASNIQPLCWNCNTEKGDHS